MRFLLASATRNNAPETAFCEELQQLGLPKEHSHVLCRVLAEKRQHIQKILSEGSLFGMYLNNSIFTHICNFKFYSFLFLVNLMKDFKCDVLKSRADCAQMTISIKNEIVDGAEKNTSHQIKVRDSDLSVLLSELKVVNDIMKNYNYEQKYADL